jgi:hypothetical protein
LLYPLTFILFFSHNKIKREQFFSLESPIPEKCTGNKEMNICSARIYGPICEAAIWRSRNNEELYRLYDETDLVTTIRITRLRLAEHIARMQDKLPCKKITLDKPESRRRVKRPNLRWTDGVMRDAERLVVRNWRIRTKDRDGWGRFLESAKTLHGL